MKKRTSARRAATFLAALGALVMSSGVALMVTATSADAAAGHDPVGICHATSSDANPYVFITVDRDSARYVAHLAHHNTPNKTWQGAGTWDGATHEAGDPKADIIEGIDGAPTPVTKAYCNQPTGEVPPPDDLLATASVIFQDPSCANGNVAKYTTAGDHVTFDNPVAAPGATITVTATADEDASFADDSDQKSFGPHTFGPVVNCSSVEAPKVCPPGSSHAGQQIPAGQTEASFCPDKKTVVDAPKTKTKAVAETAAVTPTVVHAGLTSVSTKDMRGEQGLALMVSGMVMLAAAGGLGLRLRGAASRI